MRSFQPDTELPNLLKADFGAHVSACAVSLDATTVGYALGDGTIALFSPGNGEMQCIAAHTGAALCLVATSQGFVSGGDDGRVLLIDPTGAVRELAVFPGQWIEHAAADRNGQVLVVACGKQVILFDSQTLAPTALPELPSSIGGLAVSPDGRAVAVSHYNGVTVYAPPRPQSRGNTFDGPGSNLTLTFSPDGSKMACATQDKSVRVYDLDQAAGYLLEGYPAKVRGLSFSNDNAMLWTGGEQAFVGWPVAASANPAAREALVFGTFEHGLLGMVAAHPSLSLVAGGFDGGVIFFGSPEHKGAAPIFALGNRRVTCLSWSLDGRWLVGGGDNGAAFFMNLAE